jgi:hypothetical protein
VGNSVNDAGRGSRPVVLRLRGLEYLPLAASLSEKLSIRPLSSSRRCQQKSLPGAELRQPRPAIVDRHQQTRPLVDHDFAAAQHMVAIMGRPEAAASKLFGRPLPWDGNTAM